MNKGITVRQAAQVCRNFSDAGILVHAYLMYGFPTQTGQETVDSLEMVRQFFQEGLIQSAFWHRFTATVHSDVGRNPEKYRIRILDRPAGGFAKNDLVHEDPAGCDHDAFARGLNKAVYNFMHGIGLDFAMRDWFEFPVPAVSVKRSYVAQALNEKPVADREQHGSPRRLAWERAGVRQRQRTEGRTGLEKAGFDSRNRAEEFEIAADAALAGWVRKSLEQASPGKGEPVNIGSVEADL